MNKKIIFLAIFSVSNLFSFGAKAEGFFGIDLLGVTANHQFIGSEEQTSADREQYTPQRRSVGSKNLGFGVNLGTKLYAGESFFSTEVFYDYLDSSTKDFYSRQNNFTQNAPEYKDDVLEIKSRYGVKFNVGHRIYKDLDVFATAGLGYVDMSVKWRTSPRNSNYKASDISPIFGGGFIYDLTKKVSIKAAYDYQKMKMTYVVIGQRDEIRMHTARVGLLYYF